ncbi:MAG: Alpha/beta hydrolase fold [Microbacterium sp.]|jgi:pimeloyl-ACP methyl ester carboxylesterase|uniref:alpha/beta fold hydrolase n=1 Tax=Microbacterium sp. TaxID=51671 RepID=UPI00262AD8AF|nr:alpha/beta hydrolase [Microbacterium sp.]MDF2562768.1 Alpha/beta hydrolase fold [Microbacterium sp.]
MEFEHVTFDLPHGTFHALQGGDPDGQPTLFLHGFPDHPPTAKPFLAELGRRGRRVLAPWLRGYAPSPSAGPFDFASLTGDVLALIDRWSPRQAVELIGHDWGAFVTYNTSVTAPERIERAAALSIPHPLTFLSGSRPAQLRRSWYMSLFQLPGSGWLASANDFALIDRLWRQWSPGFALDPALRTELHEHLKASMPAPLKYYREMLRPGMLAAARRLSQPITVPMLQLHGADDQCILPSQVDDGHRFAAPISREVVAGVGHFPHIEAPVSVAERIAAWATAADQIDARGRDRAPTT